MTARLIWEGMLTELDNVNASNILLQDFNYYINKAITLYVNKRYNIYDINLLTTDDLRVLKASSFLDVLQVKLLTFSEENTNLFEATYEAILPADYFHLLNCICVYKVKENYKCYKANSYVQFAAKRLTADAWSIVVNDYFNRPLPERPYYYINNVNINNTIPTNPLTVENPNGTDISVLYENQEDKSNFPRTITLGEPVSTTISTVEKETAMRYGNPSNVRLEIRYGYDRSVFELVKVLIDYIKVPQTINLTWEQVNLTQDTSLIIEFPDYVCQEIINELTMLVMANIGDPRLQTTPVISQSIANPTQSLSTKKSKE